MTAGAYLAVGTEGVRAAERVDPSFASADGILSEGVSRRVFPGGVLLVGRRAGVVHLRASGRLSWDATSPPVRADTIYDLASLTKVVATTTAAMVLSEDGRLELDDPVSHYVPEFRGHPPGRARVRDLLAHSAGLPAWAPLYRDVRGREAYLSRIAMLEFEFEPGSRSLYSDLGMIVLGAVVEKAGGERLDSWSRRRIFEPLGMRDTGFRPEPRLRARIAPTGECAWRGRPIRGEVHDENAYAMDGVAGHAGLFGTAPDVARLATLLLGGGAQSGRSVVSADTVKRFTRPTEVPGSTRTLGWETPRGDPWAGTLWSDQAFGHTGLTGTVLWIDPTNDVFLILLTNVQADTGVEAFRDLRRRLSDQVLSIMRSTRR